LAKILIGFSYISTKDNAHHLKTKKPPSAKLLIETLVYNLFLKSSPLALPMFMAFYYAIAASLSRLAMTIAATAPNPNKPTTKIKK
jgi:hypothetical protein